MKYVDISIVTEGFGTADIARGGLDGRSGKSSESDSGDSRPADVNARNDGNTRGNGDPPSARLDIFCDGAAE